MDEASLLLSGFVDSDTNAWEKVADQYLWGTYSTKNNKHFDRQTLNWITQTSVNIALNIWDGKTEPQLHVFSITNEVSPQNVARQLAQATAPFLVRTTGAAAAEGTRQRVSATLLAQFNAMQTANPNLGVSLNSLEGRQAWLEAVRVLETACFFDPANAVAREQWLGLRWGLFPGFATHNQFAFVRRRSEAWGKYVDQFGFKSARPGANASGIVSEYVVSGWRPFEMFSFAQENQKDCGIPTDAGLREVAAWQTEFGSEFIKRWVAAPDDPVLSPQLFNFFYGALKVDNARLVSQMIAKFWPQILARARTGPVSLTREPFSRYRGIMTRSASRVAKKYFWFNWMPPTGRDSHRRRRRNRKLNFRVSANSSRRRPKTCFRCRP